MRNLRVSSILIEIFLCIDDEKWTVDEFLEKSEETCRCAAIELNRKSNMVSEAVEEVLSLVQNATQVFKAMIGAENSLLVQGSKLILKTGSSLEFTILFQMSRSHHHPKQKNLKMMAPPPNRKTGAFCGHASKTHYHFCPLAVAFPRECRYILGQVTA